MIYPRRHLSGLQSTLPLNLDWIEWAPDFVMSVYFQSNLQNMYTGLSPDT